MADDEVRISASVQGEVEEAMHRIERAVENTDEALEDAGRSGEVAGERIERGMDSARRSTNRARDAAGRFLPVNERLQDGLDDTGRKARRSARGLDAWARSAGFAQRRASGLALTLTLIKFGTIITGGAAAVSMLVALGAGAVMAVGALSPMVATLSALGPLLFAGAGALGVFTIAAEDAKAVLSPLGEDLKQFRDEISSQLIPGLQEMVELMRGGFIPVLGGGLTELARVLGINAAQMGRFLSSARTLNGVGAIFGGLEPILVPLGRALTFVLAVLLDLTYAALPMARSMAEALEQVTRRLRDWMAEITDSGRAQAWLMESWQLMRNVGHVLADLLVGLFHIFRIGGRIAREELGGGIMDATGRFREWAKSVEGQASIADYFRDALPVIRETVLLLGAIAAGLAKFASDPTVAPLLAQIRTELLPALGDLLRNITSEGGLGPALVSMFTSVAEALALIPIDGLVWIVQGIAGLASAVAWLVSTIPGLGTVLGLFGSFVVAGAAIGGMWIWLKRLGKMLKPVTGALGKLYTRLNVLLAPFGGVTGALRLLVGWLGGLAAKLGQLALRGFMASMGLLGKVVGIAARGLSWMSTALMWVGRALLFAGRALLGLLIANPIVAAIVAVVGILIWMWFRFEWFRDAVWAVLDFIAKGFRLYFEGVKFVVQVVIFIIVAYITMIATVAQWVWQGIAVGASWVWGWVMAGFGLLAAYFSWVFGKIAGWASWLWDGFTRYWQVAVAVLKAGWQTVVDWFQNTIFGPIAEWASWLWTGFTLQWRIAVALLKAGWQAIVGWFQDTIFGPIGNWASGLWDKLRLGFEVTAMIVKGAWQSVIDAVKSAYNWVARGWNSIPAITVPEWVPGIGGKEFGLPKLPTLWHGGTVEYGTALVGELGPEAVVKGGRITGMVGLDGPELRSDLPRGGYVVPNLDTLSRMPGLTKQIPGSVADAVSRSLPGYSALLNQGPAEVGSPDVHVHVDTGSEPVVAAIEALTEALLTQRPARGADSSELAEALTAAMRDGDRARHLASRYSYTSPRRPR